MPRMIFPNIAVADLERSVGFFTNLGFTFNPRFTDDNATCMVINENASVMLLTRERFSEFTRKPIVDSHEGIEAIIALSVDSRDEVDQIAETALASGGSSTGEPLDHGFMYSRSFEDPDGHVWEIFWMDPGHVE